MTEGLFVDHWRKGSSVPDISKLETQLWFYYLAGSYMNLGCEAFHLGQVELIGMNDPDRMAWAGLLAKIREYAGKHARRNWVLLDAHVPKGDMIKDGVSLIDFNSFPLRIKEIPEKPLNPSWRWTTWMRCSKKAKDVSHPVAGGAVVFPTWLNLIITGGAELPT